MKHHKNTLPAGFMIFRAKKLKLHTLRFFQIEHLSIILYRGISYLRNIAEINTGGDLFHFRLNFTVNFYNGFFGENLLKKRKKVQFTTLSDSITFEQSQNWKQENL